jgi:hypothetical protein
MGGSWKEQCWVCKVWIDACDYDHGIYLCAPCKIQVKQVQAAREQADYVIKRAVDTVLDTCKTPEDIKSIQDGFAAYIKNYIKIRNF